MILYFLDGLTALWAPLGNLSSLAARAGLAALISFGTALLLGPRLLRWLRSKQYIEHETHTASATLNAINAAKRPTPTMGGLMIVGAVLVAGIVCGDLSNDYVLLAVLSTLGYGFIGFIDDWVKLTHPAKKGLQAATKSLLQLLVASSLAFVITLIFQRQGRPELLALHVPYTGATIDLSGWGGLPHMVFVLLVVIGTSNAVNLTDGMDGLAAGSLVVAALAMAVISVAVGRAHTLEIDLFYVPYSQEMTVFCTAMAGATLGFLWFNAAPALVYMGDTGSLPLGSLLGYVAVVTKHELVLFIVGGVFVAEALSVILQVTTFKVSKGRFGFFSVDGSKRLLRCAPLHHHFQFAGVPNTRIVVRFWIVSVLCAAAGLASLAVI
ncbi:MAG: phospho-N-acetylmuramoyl-pentapeptide-transferase [Planctomycetes bacterium]|nr:phospho-N-acetylmuramoyl-pentapeptide-transferase [Planctomycetota bacterium]